MSLAQSSRSLGIVGTLVLTLGAFGACGRGSGAAAPATPPRELPAATASSDPSCPVSVPGTSVSVEDSATGAALVFVTTSDLAELRKRLTAAAEMHNEHHGAMGPLPDGTGGGEGGHAGHDMSGGGHAGHAMTGGGHEGHDASKPAGPFGRMVGVHSRAAVTEIEGGAKLELTVNSADVAKLQSELRMHAQHLASGTCEMGSH